MNTWKAFKHKFDLTRMRDKLPPPNALSPPCDIATGNWSCDVIATGRGLLTAHVCCWSSTAPTTPAADRRQGQQQQQWADEASDGGRLLLCCIWEGIFKRKLL
jgi:hypothetical protein